MLDIQTTDESDSDEKDEENLQTTIIFNSVTSVEVRHSYFPKRLYFVSWRDMW